MSSTEKKLPRGNVPADSVSIWFDFLDLRRNKRTPKQYVFNTKLTVEWANLLYQRAIHVIRSRFLPTGSWTTKRGSADLPLRVGPRPFKTCQDASIQNNLDIRISGWWFEPL